MPKENKKIINLKRRMPVGDLQGHFSDKASFYTYLKEQCKRRTSFLLSYYLSSMMVLRIAYGGGRCD